MGTNLSRMMEQAGRTIDTPSVVQEFRAGMAQAECADPEAVRPAFPGPVTRKTRVFLFAEVRLYRESLVEAMRDHPLLDVVGALPAPGDLSAWLSPVDVVLVDAAACEAGLLSCFRKQWGLAKVVAYAVYDDRDDAIRCAEAGAVGYVSRAAGLNELVDTILRVAAGEFLCSPRIAERMAQRLSAVAGMRLATVPQIALTERERQVAGLIDLGMSNKEIAKRLHIELSTVKHHVHQILHKTRASRRSQAAARLRPVLAPAVSGVPGI